MMRSAAVVLALGLFIGSANAQGPAPFERLAGHWTGTGTIELDRGSEPIKCRASYDVLGEQSKMQLDIRCASDSYNFDLQGSATYSAGAISGNWSEATRNAAGTISGKADGDRFEVVAKSSAFTAELSLITRGDKQLVQIRSRDQNTSVKGASITLQRG